MHVEVVGAQVTDLPLDIGAIVLTINGAIPTPVGARTCRWSVQDLSLVRARTCRLSVQNLTFQPRHTIAESQTHR